MARRRTTAKPSGHLILVVDDQEETLISNRLLLEREGHRVLTANGGEEALTLFRPGDIHLVIVDYFMPRMSGEELVQAIRGQDANVQIVLQTGYAGEKPPRDMLRLLDIQGYHDKTDGPDRLLLWVDVALKAGDQLKHIREAEQDIAASRSQLQELSARLIRLQEEERERISRELHDHLGQLLTAIGMDVEWALGHCPTEFSAVHERMEEATRLIQEAVQTTRELSATLRPGDLKGLGLEASLQTYTRDFGKRSGLAMNFSSNLGEHALSSEVATNIYRIAQEALTNIARHAAATQVHISLRCTEKKLEVTITDNGKGFAADRISDPHAVGLVGMQERTRLIGGDLVIRSAPGAGSSIILEVPLPAEGSSHDHSTASR
jgi:signal transduction histidine kinase